MVWIRVYPPIGEPRVFKFDQLGIKIGRRADNDLVLDDVYVSRVHAEIGSEDNHLVLKDQNSRFGCYVNGIRVGKQILNPGDEIQLGNTILRIVDESATERIKPIRLVQATRSGLEELKKQIDDLKGLTIDSEMKRRLKIIEQSLTNFEQSFDEVEEDRELARTLIEVGRATNLIIDLRVLLNLILDFALRILQGNTGIIIVEDEIRAARGINVDQAPSSPLYRLALDCLSKKHSLSEADCVASPVLKKDGSIIGSLCIGLLKKPEPRAMTVLEGFASQAGLAIESVMLHNKIRKEERIRSRLSRFFSPSVVDAIAKGEHRLGGVQIEATVLFADIRGFTPMVENLKPDYTVELLNQFLSAMTDEVFNEDGTLDKYIGDCVMAIFGAPIGHPDDPLRAVRTGLGMNKRIAEINDAWREKGFTEELSIGIGINTGKVLAGNIGSEKRMDYTVISDAVNLGSRLEGVARPGQIIISNFTYEKVKDFVETKKLEPVRVQGKKEPIQIYEVLGLK